MPSEPQPTKRKKPLPFIEGLSLEKAEALYREYEAELTRRTVENKLANYKPYPKQAAFHAAGAQHRERLFAAANQIGKTTAGGMEAAMHATGRYPDWWTGRRIEGENIGWVAGITSEGVRDTGQRLLLGRTGEYGTGCLPKETILEIVPGRGVPECVDIIRARHVSGGISTIGFKAYSDQRSKFQGETLAWCYLDEEPPADIYSECLTRTNTSSGPVWITATPLLGMSTVVQRFLLEKSDDRCHINATIDDAEHFTDEQRKQIAASYAPHEREARVKGIPVLGSGRIFPIAEETIACEKRDFPKHWPRIGGMDFGWDHPFAAVELYWDRDTDTVYVSKCYRVRAATPIAHAAALRPWGKDLPWAWPRDGKRETLEGAGVPLADQYREQGLNTLPEHAQFLDGTVGVEAGIADMLIRMESGRFRVFKHLTEWFDEFRLYHRRDGKIHKEGDDLLCATRYACMMLRFARTAREHDSFYRDLSDEYAKIYV